METAVIFAALFVLCVSAQRFRRGSHRRSATLV
jgi:hypothetical protein